MAGTLPTRSRARRGRLSLKESYYRARYYDPIRSRFVGEDPIGAAGGDRNFYAYTWNAPLRYSDPFGLQARTPATGPPNSGDSFPDPRGGRTDRLYGPDGKATKDIDYGHDHGVGDPHAHDWDWSKADPRQPGRAPRPGEIPAPVPEPIPWWQRVPWRIPGPLPLIINWCELDPSLPGCSCYGPWT